MNQEQNGGSLEIKTLEREIVLSELLAERNRFILGLHSEITKLQEENTKLKNTLAASQKSNEQSISQPVLFAGPESVTAPKPIDEADLVSK